MQALWSRAGPAHHSAYKAGFNAAGGMIRQSATRATRRKPTFTEIFTACYTSIMGTAAVLDARAKDRRRLDLERQLEDARAELESVRQQGKTVQIPPPDAEFTPRPSAPLSPWPLPPQSSLSPLSSMSLLSSPLPQSPPPGSIENRYRGSLSHHIKQGAEICDFLDSLSCEDDWAKLPPRTRELEFWRKTSGLPMWESIKAQGLLDHEALLEMIMTDELKSQERHIAHRTPKTMKQLRMAGLHTVKLVYKIMETSESFLGEESSQRLEGNVEKLRRQALPRYEATSSIDTIESCSRDLNKILADIFLNKDYYPETKIARVCYNLLVSPYPPTIFTYNLLILGFNHSRLNEQAQCVVDSFFRSKLEPTQRTLVCLLNHYNQGADKEGFYGVIMRMTGKDHKGIKIRRKLVDNVLWHRQLMRWATTKNVAVNNSYVIERAWFDVDVFTTMIKGMLRFDFLGHAVATFAIALEYGVVFSVRLVKMLLESSINNVDTKCAHQMLLAFQFRDTLLKDTFREEEDQVYLAGRIQDLIDVCLLDHAPFHVVPWLDVPASILPPKERRRALRILSVAQQLRRSHDECLDMEKKLRSILGWRDIPEFDTPGSWDRKKTARMLRNLRRMTKAATLQAQEEREKQKKMESQKEPIKVSAAERSRMEGWGFFDNVMNRLRDKNPRTQVFHPRPI